MSVLTSSFPVPRTVPSNLADLYNDTLRQIGQDAGGPDLISLLLDHDLNTWHGYEDEVQIYLLEKLMNSKAEDLTKTLFVKAMAIHKGVYDKFMFDGEPMTLNLRPERWEQHFHSVMIFLQEKYEGDIPVWNGIIGKQMYPFITH
mgnify:CR=1 FL=1